MPPNHAALLADHDMAWAGERLCYGGCPVDELVRETGTPAFIYLDERVSRNYRHFAEACEVPPWDGAVFYSAKTAPEPRLLRILRGHGAYVEVACLRELELALRNGFEPSRIMLDGPAHTEEVLRQALARGVELVKVDSLDQLRTVAAASNGSSVRVLLRLRSPTPRWAQSPAEGLITRFGLSGVDLRRAWDALRSYSHVHLDGLAVHVGSQVAGTGPYRRAGAALARAARDAWNAGLRPAILDVGGGFPSATLRSPSAAAMARAMLGRAPAPPLRAYGAALRDALRPGRVPEEVTTIALEPGRVLVGSAAVLVTRVAAVKGSWVFLDASRNFVPESLLFAQRTFLPARRGATAARRNLAGCTLSGGDVLALGARLPQCSVGDVLVMLDAGAYTLSKANRFTTAIPPVFALTGEGRLEAMREGGTDDAS
ncbi:MAG: alanine racemase [Candidatus Eisenbacteria bacterium]|jgi:diaminopimelate decarboxylase|nr:alanine racemase [Candidatus Eisenbacteria bacterium]